MSSAGQTSQLIIDINGTTVGEIVRLADDRTIFSFDKTYRQDRNRPVLSLSFKSIEGDLLQSNKPRRSKLDPYFSNLLPEGYLRSYLSEKLKINSQREFFLLNALGEDLPGAVRARAYGQFNHFSDSNINTSIEHQDRDTLRFSLAGIQLKFSAIMESKGRLTIPANGQGGHWILKLPAGNFKNVPDAEFAMMTLAKNAGIAVPEFKLIPTQLINGLPKEFQEIEGDSLAVKRFDRGENGERIHMEDFAQIFGFYSHDKYKKRSYANIAEVLWIEAGERSVAEFIRRLVFNLIIGNGDMHLKNWSVLYRNPVKPELSPAYDFIPTIAFLENQTLALNLGDSKTFSEIDVTHFQKLAATAKIPERFILKIVEEAKEASYTAWQENKASLPLSVKTLRTIDSHISKLGLLKPKLK